MSLELTRKRAKEIKKLRKKADKIWAEQRVVSHHAAELAREARDQARAYGNESLLPAAEHALHRGVDASRNGLASATRGWNKQVVPAIASGLGSFAAMAQIAKDDRVKSAIDSVRRYATVPEVAPARSAKSGPNAFQWVLIGVGAVAVVSAAYAAWQTLRADDDLWIPDAEDTAIDAPPRPADQPSGGLADGPEAGSPQA
ncbi:hypothetical protein [Agrococcus carbonis]|uniref:DNA helicase n=1 Tax=Agrococcus carbonis TaxID=684552 RepID=A0A1H1PAZ2_9MICO|nr:hypothetical protein [Agrococcus carbonis]SDS08294.1 hypothetical protein SAMN04489719_1499 [Agrococcus carbonis]